MSGVDDSATVRLLHMDGADGSTAFVDEAGHKTTPIGSVQIDNAQSKFGGTSALFDGTSDAINLGWHADFYFGISPFTVDCWFRMSAISRGVSNIIISLGGSNEGFCIYIDTDNKLKLWYSGAVRITDASTVSADTWYHIALVGNGGATGSRNLKLYKDGTQIGSTYTVDYDFSPNDFYIGANQNSMVESHLGWIDEVRISRVQRWTGNFTPPTEPYNAPSLVSIKSPRRDRNLNHKTPFIATGGTITYANGRTIHTFTSGTTALECLGETFGDILVVAGGGGGSSGGGGGGGVIYYKNVRLAGTLQAVVGSGGAGKVVTTAGDSGGTSVLYAPDYSYGATGGGGGGKNDSATTPGGGCGGGGGATSTVNTNGGTGNDGHGYAGGSVTTTKAAPYPSAGGGGAGNYGFPPSASNVAGNGGQGIYCGISGSMVAYGGGGGGACYNAGATHGTGGIGGGGDGGANGVAGTANTGGGGGGCQGTGTGGNGGSGIIIVSYPTY